MIPAWLNSNGLYTSGLRRITDLIARHFESMADMHAIQQTNRQLIIGKCGVDVGVLQVGVFGFGWQGGIQPG